MNNLIILTNSIKNKWLQATIILIIMFFAIYIFAIINTKIIINDDEMEIIVPQNEYIKTQSDSLGFKFRVKCKNYDRIRLVSLNGVVFLIKDNGEIIGKNVISSTCNRDFYWNSSDKNMSNISGEVRIDVINENTRENKVLILDANGNTIKYVNK